MTPAEPPGGRPHRGGGAGPDGRDGPHGRDDGGEDDGGRVVVTGATGFTGGLVADRLSETGLPALLTGRSEEKLAGLADRHPGAALRTVDVTDTPRLRGLLREGDVLVNCAGPFTEVGEPAVRAAVEAGAHYLDTTGEQAFMRRVLEAWDRPARAAGVAVVNAMAFEYALGDCALALAAERLPRPAAAADVVYSWRGDAGATSAGTRRSVLRAVAHPGVVRRDGRWEREPVGRRRRTVRPPGGPELPAVSLPAGEVLTAPRHLGVDDARGWMIVGAATARVLPWIAPVLPALVRAGLPLLDPFVARGPAGPEPSAREASRFQVLARVVDADGGVATVAVDGRDPYGVTAAIVVAGVRAALARQAPAEAGSPGDAGPDRSAGSGPPVGVLPPALLVEPGPFLDGLAPAGVRWRSVSDPFRATGGHRT